MKKLYELQIETNNEANGSPGSSYCIPGIRHERWPKWFGFLCYGSQHGVPRVCEDQLSPIQTQNGINVDPGSLPGEVPRVCEKVI